MLSPLTPGVYYPLSLAYVVDGDTLAGTVHLPGPNNYPTHVRIWGINSPETRGPTRAAGYAAKLAAVRLVAGATLRVRGRGHHLDKYGRVVADVECTPPAYDGGGTGLAGEPPTPVDFGGAQITNGFAVEYMRAA